MVLKTDAVGSIKRMEKAKTAVFAGGVDTSATETKGTVLIHTADQVTVAKNEEGGNSVSTVLLRGSTDSILDDLEKAVDDGVNTYKAMCKDSRIVLAAAATEIELARRVKEFSFTETDWISML